MARSHRGRNGSLLATLVYVVAWLVAAIVLVGVLLAVLDGGEPEEVSLPPVHETQLAQAARRGGCELRYARPRERLNPPVIGGAGALPAQPGFYEESPSVASLLAALRGGIVVMQFRRLDDGGVMLLRRLQAAVPRGTIVVPNETGMRFTVAVTAYRRLLGCEALNQAAVDAMQLFRGRFVGLGPDA